MQAKISSFFKTHCDSPPPPPPPPPPPRISDQIDGGKVEIFGRNDPAEILITYKRRDPKLSDSISDDDITQSDINEKAKTKITENTPSRSDVVSKDLNKKRTYSQFHLELGQSDFLLHTCSVCGLAYARGDEGDEKVHKAFHRDYYQGIQFKGWRKERVVFKCDSNADRIVLVLDDDPSAHKYKVQQVVKTMEKELGFGDGRLLHRLCQVYLFISSHRIVGCLIAEPIKTAHKVISSTNPSKESNGSSETMTMSEAPKQEETVRTLQFGNIKFQREVVKKNKSMSGLQMNEAILCEEEAVPAVCGIRAIWAVAYSRRKRVASRLLDATRKSFCANRELEVNQCAFSSPTSAGKAFASKYSGSNSFLIYKTE